MKQSNTNQIEELSPRQVADLLNARAILLVDVREPDEYAAQRIAGALLFPLSTLDALTGGIGAWESAGLPILQLDPATGRIAST
jgi:rhodanese-related sulfurtransferase